MNIRTATSEDVDLLMSLVERLEAELPAVPFAEYPAELKRPKVERMVSDAQSHAEDDKARREAIEGRNRADTLVYATEKTLSENRDKLSAADVEPVEQALQATKLALEGGDHATIEAAAATLQQASHKLAEALYKQASAGAPPPEAPASGEAQGAKKGDGDVIDAEVVDEK